MSTPRNQNLALFLSVETFVRPNFSVLICRISALAALQRPLCTFNVLPVFSLDQAFSQSSNVFRSDASLTCSAEFLPFCYISRAPIRPFPPLLSRGFFGSNVHLLIPFCVLMRGYLVKVD